MAAIMLNCLDIFSIFVAIFVRNRIRLEAGRALVTIPT
jgi:hypothetical protein